ncbi:MAG: response regulator transcription factor, partial [Acidimicrobiales bacterium]
VSRSREVLAEALGVAEAAGASSLAWRARDELSVAGGRRRRVRDPDALSAQEARVAAMAATGATNAEIAQSLYLSTRTVETHLTHVYAKLGVASRADLRRRRSEFNLA